MSASKRTIIAIAQEKHKSSYWDLQVLNTNNYVTEDGTIHHNSGKSSGCVVELFRRGMSQRRGPNGTRRTRWAVVRNTYRQLEDTTIKTFKDWFPPDEWGRWREKDMSYVFTAAKGVELEVLFRALDRPDQVSNLLSLELTGAWINEARELPLQIVEAIQGRLGRYPPAREEGCTWSGLMMDTNPPDDDHWWYQLFEETRPPNAAIFKQPSGQASNAENIPNLPPDYYTNLAQGKKLPFIKVYVDGQYGSVSDGMGIYKDEWNDQLHISTSQLNPNAKLIIGMDFGLTPAAVIGQISTSGRLHIRHEITSTGMGTRRFVRTQLRPFLAEHYPYTSFDLICDPAGQSRSESDEKSSFDQLRTEDFNPLPASSNNPERRWDAVKWYLTQLADGEPAITIHPDCKQLRKGFNGGYRLRRLQVAGEERYESKADKNRYSHPHDALQYLALHARADTYEMSYDHHEDIYEPDPIAVY